MSIFYKTIVLFFALTAYAAAQSGSSYKVNLKYKAYWGGFTVAEINSDTIIDNDNYEVSADYQVKGIASIVGKMQNHTQILMKSATCLRNYGPFVHEPGMWWNLDIFSKSDF